MVRLENVSLDELRSVLEDVESKKPTQRLMIAILYKHGHSVPTIAEWYQMRENTIYDWFDRFETEPVEQAVHDRPKPGRPPKLDVNKKQQLHTVLDKSPEEAGYNAPTWSPALVQRHIRNTYNVEYSLRYTRTIMHEAGVSWKTARPQ